MSISLAEAMPELAEWKQGASEKYLKWRFTKRAKARGIYDEFSPVPRESELVITTVKLGGMARFGKISDPNNPYTNVYTQATTQGEEERGRELGRRGGKLDWCMHVLAAFVISILIVTCPLPLCTRKEHVLQATRHP